MNMRDVISIFYPDGKARLGELVVDAFLKETHGFSSELTEHPIESGGVIVDHVHNLPFCPSIDGIISNTPMSLVGLTAFDSAKRFLEGNNNDFALIAFEKIDDIFARSTPISIATSFKTYHKMVLERLSIERGEVFTNRCISPAPPNRFAWRISRIYHCPSLQNQQWSAPTPKSNVDYREPNPFLKNELKA